MRYGPNILMSVTEKRIYEHIALEKKYYVIYSKIHSHAYFTCSEQTAHRACEASIHQATCFLVKHQFITVILHFVQLCLIQY